MAADHPQRRGDYWEHGLAFGCLRPACREVGIDLVEVVWDDPGVEPLAFDAFVIGTTWDYPQRAEAFVAALERFAAVRPVFNGVDVVRWNLQKRYLRALAGRGIDVVPTVWCDRVDERVAEDAFRSFEVDEVVIKPQVGAGAWRQVRLRRGDGWPEAATLPAGAAMVQPFLPAIVSEGEYSFVYFGLDFSHALRKIPADGDYRVQSVHGGREVVYEPTAAELAMTRRVVEAVDQPLLYARVDLVRGLDGGLCLMELELIEPYLYPEQGPAMEARFAAALSGVLESGM